MRPDLPARVKALRGCLSDLKTTKGRRLHPPDEDDDPFEVSDPFVGDEAKIMSSKAFRTMKYKTQVLTNPQNPMIRSRHTHVMEVVAVSVITADLLGLNTSLARAIALGHDIGHVPYGHQGEIFMAKAMGKKEFCHERMGPIIAQKIERHGRGLNLTFETLEGMMCHSGKTVREGMTPEAWVVRYADKFAYIFADYNDVVQRMKFHVRPELRDLMDEFGPNQRLRTSTAMGELVIESAECGKVSFEHSECAKNFARLRELMYEVYVRVTEQNPAPALEPVLDFLRATKLGDPFLLLALMTDRDVTFLAREPMKNVTHLECTALRELIPNLEEIGHVDLCNPCLDW